MDKLNRVPLDDNLCFMRFLAMRSCVGIDEDNGNFAMSTNRKETVGLKKLKNCMTALDEQNVWKYRSKLFGEWNMATSSLWSVYLMLK